MKSSTTSLFFKFLETTALPCRININDSDILYSYNIVENGNENRELDCEGCGCTPNLFLLDDGIELEVQNKFFRAYTEYTLANQTRFLRPTDRLPKADFMSPRGDLYVRGNIIICPQNIFDDTMLFVQTVQRFFYCHDNNSEDNKNGKDDIGHDLAFEKTGVKKYFETLCHTIFIEKIEPALPKASVSVIKPDCRAHDDLFVSDCRQCERTARPIWKYGR